VSQTQAVVSQAVVCPTQPPQPNTTHPSTTQPTPKLQKKRRLYLLLRLAATHALNVGQESALVRARAPVQARCAPTAAVAAAAAPEAEAAGRPHAAGFGFGLATSGA
jgi:hypothetical protein